MRSSSSLEERGEDTSILSDAGWVLDLAFLTDLTGKLNQLNLQLQGNGKTICDMISAVKAFKANLCLYLQQIKVKKLHHFPSVQKVLQENKAAAGFLNLSKYCDCLTKLGQEFEDRFLDFEQLDPCAL